jgi:hypothetical protein
MNREQIWSLIAEAFKGVTLEDGISLLQSIVIDNYGEGYTDEEFEALKQKENVTDWQSLKLEDLKKLEIAHLDEKGFRYYIPACMTRFMDSYVPLDIGDRFTTSVLFFLDAGGSDPEYPHSTVVVPHRYKFLNRQQHEAVAQFLYWLPAICKLGTFDQKQVETAFNHYWKDYLPQEVGHN